MYRIMLLIFSAIVLSACSPYVYRAEVTSLDQSVSSAAANFNAELNAIGVDAVASAIDRGQSAMVRDKPSLDLSESCLQLQIPKAARSAARQQKSEKELISECVVLSKTTGLLLSPPIVGEVDAAMLDKARKHAAALSGYTKALATLVDASDSDKFRAAASELGGALHGLAERVDKESPGTFGETAALIQPVTELLFAPALIGLERRRLRVMREVVPAVNPAIETLTAALDAAVPFARNVALRTAFGDLSAAQADWNVYRATAKTERREVLIERLAQALIDYRAAASAVGRPGPFAKVAKAHEALVNALAEHRSVAQAENLIQRLSELKEAVSAVSKAAGF